MIRKTVFFLQVPMTDLATRLIEIRGETGLSTRGFATALKSRGYEISHTTVSAYENGTGPPAAYLEAVSRVFAVSPTWLLCGEGLHGNVEPAEIESTLQRIVALVEDIRPFRSRREAQLDSFFQLSPDTFLILTPNGHIARWNAAFEELTGSGRDQSSHTSFFDWVHENDREVARENLCSFVKGGRTVRCEFTLRVAHGGYRAVECHASSGTDLVFAVLRDIRSPRI